MGLLDRSKTRLLPLGRRALAAATLRPAAVVVLALALALGILWLTAGPAQAVTATGVTIPGGLTTTTVFTLSQPVQTQVDALTAQAHSVESDLAVLNAQLDRKIQDYYQCQADLKAANDRLSELRRMVAAAQTKRTQAQQTLDARVKAVYMSGGRDQLLQLLLTSDSLQDFYNRMRLVSTIADQDKQIVADLADSGSRLALLAQASDSQRHDQMVLERRLTEESSDLQATLAQKQQMLDGLNTQVKTIIDQERQRQAEEQARIEAEQRAQMLAAQAAAAAAAQAAAQTAAQNQSGNGNGSGSGGYNYSGSNAWGANRLSGLQIAAVAQKAGFTGQNLEIAVAVALAESGGNPRAIGDRAIGGSFGLWQIYCVAHPYLISPSNPDSVAWYDPLTNAQFAYRISGGHNWNPWSTYKHGSYLSHMDEARAAVVALIGSGS